MNGANGGNIGCSMLDVERSMFLAASIFQPFVPRRFRV
jgi:hypothetical protein